MSILKFADPRPDLHALANEGDLKFIAQRETLTNRVRDAYIERGLPPTMWPSDPSIDKAHEGGKPAPQIRQSIVTGKLAERLHIDQPMRKGPIPEGKHHPKVEREFNLHMPVNNFAFYFFTNGEAWWTGKPAFLVHDPESFLEWCRYYVASTDLDTLSFGTGKPRGRPRDPDIQVAKESRKERYGIWLAECAAYRAQLEEKQKEYENAMAMTELVRLELRDMKAVGAPKWIP